MGTIEEINKLQEDGVSDEKIRDSLKRRGVSPNEIENAFSQSQIKNAVAQDNFPSNYPSQEQGSAEYSAPAPGYAGMEPSMLVQPGNEQQVYSQEGQEYSPNYSGADSYSGYSSYQPYQETISSDIVTEISEQVVNDKLSVLHDKMEKALDFRNVAEAKINAIDERLKRIEKILDRLQLSILQKVGEYVTDVKDIKKELEENRKSFKAVQSAKDFSGKSS
jgi:hypothetical protein